ncbi:MAG TPA: C40 family peptidase [Burkholderiales bacterium]|nr:C40 family peptidase [Burkholderiales bacterium]
MRLERIFLGMDFASGIQKGGVAVTCKYVRPVLIFIVVFALAACAGSPPRAAPTGPVTSENTDVSQAADHALTMLGAPYRYGGVDSTGFDCSGLVHYSFRKIGIALPRDTRSLRKIGVEIELNDLAKGDLVFFDQEGKKSSHVGIYLGEGRFVHAPSTGGKVRADKIDFAYWRKHFNEARRIRM